MKNTVHIIEYVTEIRTYEVEADNSLEAAKVAYTRWIVNGEEPDSKSQNIQEREYEVETSKTENTCFNSDDVEAE
jgi:hypothetical protein